MIVVDTSVFIDYLLEKDERRSELARQFFKVLKGLKVFVPKIFLVEFISVANRLGSKISKDIVFEISKKLKLVSEEEIFHIALDIAEKVYSRASDAYFIATAKLTNSILITNDKIMNENAKKYGIESYYLIEEFEKIEKRIKEMK